MSTVRFTGSLRERSTSAAREYVDMVRRRLASELEMHGEAARNSASHRQLERTITSDEIRRVWPHADLDQALRQDDKS